MDSSTMASLVAGNLINWLLHGALTVQVYLYYLAFPNDKTWTKVAVYTTYILETVQVIGLAILLLMTVTSVRSFAVDSFTVSSIFSLRVDDPIWFPQALLIVLVGGLVPLTAQCIYAHRIRIITQRKAIPTIIISLAILQLVAAILTGMFDFNRLTLFTLLPWLGLNVVNDLIIAFIMVRSLWKEQSLSDYTNSKVIRLINLIIATGSLTVAANGIACVCILCSSAAFRGDLIAIPLLVFTPKLYANSILVMLNNRMTIRDSHSRNAKPLNMMSTDVVSTLAIADHQTRSSDSATSHDFLSSATRSPN